MSAPPSLPDLQRAAARLLESIEAGNPLLEAQLLLARALRCSRLEILRWREEDPIPAEAEQRFQDLLRRRLDRAPLQHVLGTAPFGDLELEVGPGALIPRSETETLVDLLAREASGLAVRAGGEFPPRLIDLGTGSGAILLGLLHRLPGWRGLGIDLSAEALVWARRNRRRTGIGTRAALVRGDLLAPARPDSVLLIACNPPYVRTAELSSLAPEIREHEPRLALDGGTDGLDIVRRLLPAVPMVLREGGLFALELARDQPDEVGRCLSAGGSFSRVEVRPDLTGGPRFVLAWRK